MIEATFDLVGRDDPQPVRIAGDIADLNDRESSGTFALILTTLGAVLPGQGLEIRDFGTKGGMCVLVGPSGANGLVMLSQLDETAADEPEPDEVVTRAVFQMSDDRRVVFYESAGDIMADVYMSGDPILKGGRVSVQPTAI